VYSLRHGCKDPTYRELLKRLRQFGVEENIKRGKGSERLLVRIVDGQRLSITTKCHSGGDQKPKAVIKAIRRRLRLTPGDGISDEHFYG
jgi:hypothetical protein